MSEFLAEASILIRPNTAAFRAVLIAELTAATKGIVVPVQVAAAAGAKTAAAATQAATVSARRATVATTELTASRTRQIVADQQAGAAEAQLAAAQRAAAVAAKTEAIAVRESARAAAASAVAHEQLTRGAGASALALGGVRGATLAASGPFLVGAAAVTLLAKSVQEATKEEEALARATAVFGDEAKTLQRNARDFVSTFALDPEDFLLFEGAIGNVLRTSGLAREEIPKLSEDLVKLGADMAAFNNVPVDETLKAIQLGLVGNSRGLRRFAVELNAAAVNARALSDSGKKNTAELTREDRVRARINILFEQTALQQGAAARRSGEFAQQTKILSAQLTDLGADLGHLVIPVLNAFVQSANLSIGAIKDFVDFTKDLAPATKDAAGGVTLFGKALHFAGIAALFAFPATAPLAIKKIIDEFRDGKEAADGAGLLAFAFDRLRAEARFLIASFEAADRAQRQLTFADAIRGAAVLQDKLLDLQFRGASPAQIVANLQKQIADQQTAIVSAPTVKAKTAAKERRNQLKDQVDAIIADQKRDAQEAADKAKQAAEDIAQLVQAAADFVQQQLQKATQALLDSFSVEQAQGDLRAARAEGTKSLVDDLAALEARRGILQREITVAKKAGLDALTVLGLQTQLVQTVNQIGALEAQQAANRQQRRQTAFDRAAESVDLDIQLAQTNKNLRSEIAARQARIRLDEARAKAVRGDTLAAKRLRNDIAAQRAAIADLRKQLGERNKAFQQLSFEFLQTQTGFAANLISNLIPGSATAGLVGGAGAISTPTSPERSKPPDVGAGLGAAAQTSGGARGATSGQMGALIEINRGVLRVLTRIAGQATHPEAKNQKIAQAASMDIIAW